MMEWKREWYRGMAHLGRTAFRARFHAKGAVENASMTQVLHVARSAAQSGPVRELAAICGRAGMAGAVVDGALGGVQAAKAMREGKIDAKGAVVHASSEAGCGFVTSAAGTAGTLAAYMVTGSLGPGALVMGMGASMGSRWAYRQMVGETLPESSPSPGSSTSDESSSEDTESEGPWEEIGPR